jgi:hypothetical protein
MRQIIESKKSILTIFFCPHAFLIVDILPQDEHLTVQCFMVLAVMRLAQAHSIQLGDIARQRLQKHFNNPK